MDTVFDFSVGDINFSYALFLSHILLHSSAVVTNPCRSTSPHHRTSFLFYILLQCCHGAVANPRHRISPGRSTSSAIVPHPVAAPHFIIVPHPVIAPHPAQSGSGMQSYSSAAACRHPTTLDFCSVFLWTETHPGAPNIQNLCPNVIQNWDSVGDSGFIFCPNVQTFLYHLDFTLKCRYIIQS